MSEVLDKRRKREAIEWWQRPLPIPNQDELLLKTGPSPIAEDGSWPDTFNRGTVRDQQGGKAYLFDGINGVVSTSDSNDLTFSDGVTDQAFEFTFRFNLTSIGANDVIFAKYGGGATTNDYLLEMSGSGGLQIGLFDGVGFAHSIGRRTGSLAAYLGQDLIAFVRYDGLGLIGGISIDVFDINGTLLASNTTNVTAGSYVAMSGGTLPQDLGGTSTLNNLDGKLWDFRAFNKELTAGEETSYITNPEDALGSEVGWWRLDDNGMVNVLTLIHDSDFQGGVKSYTELNMVAAGNIDAIADTNGLSKDNVLRGYADVTDGEHNHITPVVLTIGNKYNLDIWVLVVTGATGTTDGFEILDGVVVLSNHQGVNGLWTRVNAQFIATATTLTIRSLAIADNSYIGSNTITDDLIYISEVEINEVTETPDAVPTIALDASGNNNSGIPSGGVTLVTQDVVSWQDEIGYNEGFEVTTQADVNTPISGFTEFEIAFLKADANGISMYLIDNSTPAGANGYRIQWTSGEALQVKPLTAGVLGANIALTSNSQFTPDIINVFKVTRSSSGSWSFYIDDVLIPTGNFSTGSNPLIDITHTTFTHLMIDNIIAGDYLISSQINGDTIKFSDWVLAVGAITQQYIPTRDGVNDVYGIPLAFKGTVQKPTKFVNSNCSTYNGVDDETIFGSIGNITSISLWIKLDVDNQTILSLADTAVTEVEVLAGVLTFGASLTDSNITVDGISKTGAQAGVILNDNLFHELAFDLVSIAATDFRIASANAVFGSIRVAKLQINGGVLIDTSMAEGAGDTVYDKSSNGNDGAITSTDLPAVWGNTQDVFVNNIANGFSLYEHATLDKMYVPYGVDGNPLTITPQTGYTKTSDNPAGPWYNGSENLWQMNPKDDPKISRLFQSYGWSSARLVDLLTETISDPLFINDLDPNRQKDIILYESLRNFEQVSQLRNSLRGLSEAEIITLNPTLFIEAYDENSFTLVGADISQWDSKDSAGNHPLQGDADKKPSLTTDSNKQLNKVVFDGVDEFLTLTADIVNFNDSEGEWLIVVEDLEGTGVINGFIIFGDASADVSHLIFGLNASDENYIDVGAVDARTFEIATRSTTQLYSFMSSGTAYKAFINGEQSPFGSGTNDGDFPADDANLDTLSIGSLQRLTPAYYNVAIKAMFNFPVGLTVYNRKRLQEIVMNLTRINKYNI